MGFAEDRVSEILGVIRETKDLAYLMRVVAVEQSRFWYDPCGKSGSEFEPHLTDLSKAAIKRAQKILNVNGD